MNGSIFGTMLLFMTLASAAATDSKIDSALLRATGLRVTAARLSVLRALTHTPHAPAEVVLTFVRADIGSVSTQAVYDVLHALTAAGLVQCIEPAGHPTRYERRIGDNHHHLVCRACGAVFDVDCAKGSAPCLDPSSAKDFTVDTAEVIYWGRCNACEARTD